MQRLDVVVALREIMPRPLQAAAKASSFTGSPMELLQLGAQHPAQRTPELPLSAPILLSRATIGLNGASSPKNCRLHQRLIRLQAPSRSRDPQRCRRECNRIKSDQSQSTIRVLRPRLEISHDTVLNDKSFATEFGDSTRSPRSTRPAPLSRWQRLDAAPFEPDHAESAD